jgi:hypothetical protein
VSAKNVVALISLKLIEEMMDCYKPLGFNKVGRALNYFTVRFRILYFNSLINQKNI